MRATDNIVSAVCAVIVVCMTVVACAEVELCEETVHPHSATVSFAYAFDSDDDVPDTMLVLATRVVNRSDALMAVDARTGSGYFKAGGTGKASSDGFMLPVGDYRFMTFNMDTTEMSYSGVDEYIGGEEGYGLSDIYVDYKEYSQYDEGLNVIIPDWQDYNPYAGYIQPEIHKVTVDTLAVTLSLGQNFTCNFTPTGRTQNIDIYFNIQKQVGNTPFVVDSVVGEISGLPKRMTLLDGNLDISNTCKMMFRMKTVNSAGGEQADTYSASSARCHANIDVTGIVPGRSADAITGPGILQVMIYVHAENPDNAGSVLVKKIQGKINLYNTLHNARLIDYTDDGEHVRRTAAHGVLDIEADVVIDGESIIENPDNTGGIDAWIACTDIMVEI